MKKGFTVVGLIISMAVLVASCGSSASESTSSSAGTFSNPAGVATDGTDLYIADTGNNAIRIMVISTGETTSLAGSSAGAAGSSDGTGTSALFNGPEGITLLGSNLYVADTGNNTIRKIVVSTGEVTLFAGSSTGTSGSSDGIGTAALFHSPSGIINDGTNLYVTDAGNNSIRMIVISTQEVSTL